MPRAAEARAWWADVEDVRERIERRRERERSRARETGRARGAGPGADALLDAARGMPFGRATTAVPASRRGVREVRPGAHLMLVRTNAPSERGSHRRPRPRPMERVGSRPDRIAAWAVALGFLLVVVAVLSAHG